MIKAAAEIAVVGDRLGTDGMMAGRMGSWSVWVRDGVGRETAGGKRNGLERMEAWVERLLRVRCGLRPSGPRGWNGLDD